VILFQEIYQYVAGEERRERREERVVYGVHYSQY
jgi:hypothetical protein